MSQEVEHGGTDAETQEEYQDDFEKDLDWLIDEEGRTDDQEEGYEDIEAKIDKELEEEEERERRQKEEEEERTIEGGESERDGSVEEERFPSPMEDRPDGDSSHEPVPLFTKMEEKSADEKKYLLEKIQKANHKLKDQSSPNHGRHRRLQFKDTLVDLVVPAVDYEREAEEGEVSERMSELQLSSHGSIEASSAGGKEGRVLVEKDGKFDLVSLREVESQGLLPPLSCSLVQNSPHHSQQCPDHSKGSESCVKTGFVPHYTPRPPSRSRNLSRNRPSSAGSTRQVGWNRAVKRKVQSANSTPSHSDFTLSPQQKELQMKLQHKRERLRREEEERKQAEEEQKHLENERAFQAWLSRKREQLQEERRIQRAQEIERINCKREHSSPQEAFKLWLQRKLEQQEKQRQLEDIKRLEEESAHYMHNREECERAFKLWLKKKRAEKRAEQQAARERSRRLVMEARRARRTQDLLCSVSEARSLRFTSHYSYCF